MSKSFEDWKKENPSGSLNDYYRSGNRLISQASETTFKAIEQFVQSETKPTVNLLGIGIGAIGFIGYFLPWFKMPLLNISVSGSDISQLTTIFKNNITATDLKLLKYAFVIPISSAVILLGAVSKNFWLNAIGTLSSLLVIGFIVLKVYFDIPDLMPYMDIGLYLLILSCLLSVYNLFSNK